MILRMEILGRKFTRRFVLNSFVVFAAKADDPPLHFVAKTLDGERYTNDSLKGKVVLIDFWTTWCPYCASEVRAVERIIKDYSDKGLIVLSVNMGEPKRKVKKYLDENPRSSKVVLAEDTTLAAICQAKSYPLYVLLDREGNIVGRQNGAAGESALRRLLTRAGLEDA